MRWASCSSVRQGTLCREGYISQCPRLGVSSRSGRTSVPCLEKFTPDHLQHLLRGGKESLIRWSTCCNRPNLDIDGSNGRAIIARSLLVRRICGALFV